MREMVGGCCVCSDDRGWSENPLVYCDGQSCTVAVHQACYGIVTVPTGPWYCRKCESQDRSVKVKCELCPSKHGALKRTDNSGWAHVVCALYIPEVRFGNVTTMEPIQLQLIPTERFNKVCYICEEKGKPANCTVGACMQCNKAGCKQQFHVTCAQSLGLLCEEAGNYLDNVKYCGYCQYHYSKLKKGGHVKTIPPYKPVSNETHNSDSNSEKESEAAPSISKNSPPSTGGKKKSAAGGKSSAPSKTSTKSTPTQQKTVHNNGRSSEKSRSSSRSVKNDETNPEPVVDSKVDKKDIVETDIKEKESVKDVKTAKKRKANSRTPTPVGAVTTSEISVVVTSIVTSSTVSVSSTSSVSVASERKSTNTSDSSSAERSKKAKVEATQSILHNQPVVALTSISTAKLAISPSTTTLAESEVPPTPSAPSIIQTTQTTQQAQSLVVSVPLVNAALSPRDVVVGGNQTSVLAQASASVSVPAPVPMQVTVTERSGSTGSAERCTPILTDIMTGGNSNQGILTSEMSGGGLKITYEKQMDSINTEVDMELELEPSPSTAVPVPVKRTRSQSQTQERTERSSRSSTKKRSSNSNGATPSTHTPTIASTLPKRASRSQHHQQQMALQQAAQQQQQQAMQQDTTPPPPASISEVEPPGAFAAVSQMKESPPSSPSSESQQDNIHLGRSGRHRSSRKSAPAAVGGGSGNSVIGGGGGSASRDIKDIKLFQNGLTAPHMLGNHLNPTSTMHSKMTDHLNSELEAHSIFNPNENNSNLIGPQLHHRVVQSVPNTREELLQRIMTTADELQADRETIRKASQRVALRARASSTGSSTASGGSGLSSMLGGGGGNIPQTLDQLLERQWEQGSQFLMEQAQHFDIASLLSCLHQLRAENLRLEEHVGSLLQRRDHLLAVNARLAIPLTGQPAAPQSSHPHTVNNIHPSVASTHSEVPRPSRHSTGSQGYGNHPQGSAQHQPVENGLPPDTYPQNSHRSPATGGQPSPTVRHSPAGAFSGGSGGGSGRPSAPRPQPYPPYDRPGPSTSSTQPQHQMVIRRERDRDTDLHHHSSKTS